MRKIGQTLRFLIPVIVLVALVVFMTGLGRRRMTKKAFVAAVAHMPEAWNTGNVDALDEMYTPDAVFHNPPFPDQSLEGYKKYVRDTRRTFPEVQLTLDEYILDGNKGATMFTWRATHTSGAQVTMTGCVVAHLGVDGKIVEEWNYADRLGMFQQLGFKLVPPGEQGGK